MVVAAAAIAVAGCTNGGVLRAAVPTTVPTAIPTPSRTPTADPQPLVFPRDEGPHDRLTEWWYYTGHLQSADGRDFGFEFVVFRAERGVFPAAWASHFAITDQAAQRFAFVQRSEFGPQVDSSPRGGGFDLTVLPVPGNAARGAMPYGPPWTMSGIDGRDHVAVYGSPGEIVLDLTTDRPLVLHDDDGWIDLGPAGGTYYYSRTRMEVIGTLGLPGEPGGPPFAVTGLAWFDHQWGDFIAVGAGGWDWFSVQLDDGRDLTISLVHGPGGIEVLDYGTLVAADGSARHLGGNEIRISVLGRWRSPHSGADYPAGWRIELPGEGVTLRLAPTLADQELDTTATTGVTYWEGEVAVAGTGRAGVPLAGRGYVELTGYAK
jgi:predicted secreted hydrolase